MEELELVISERDIPTLVYILTAAILRIREFPDADHHWDKRAIMVASGIVGDLEKEYVRSHPSRKGRKIEEDGE